jgi:hypothetical protein
LPQRLDLAKRDIAERKRAFVLACRLRHHLSPFCVHRCPQPTIDQNAFNGTEKAAPDDIR